MLVLSFPKTYIPLNLPPPRPPKKSNRFHMFRLVEKTCVNFMKMSNFMVVFHLTFLTLSSHMMQLANTIFMNTMLQALSHCNIHASVQILFILIT